MPAKPLPCPFCGIEPMLWDDDHDSDLIEHPNTDCPCGDVRVYCPKGDYSYWNKRAEKVEAVKTSHNSAMDAIATIEAALRIKELWAPPSDYVLEENDPHEGEMKALQMMLNNFESLVRQQHQ